MVETPVEKRVNNNSNIQYFHSRKVTMKAHKIYLVAGNVSMYVYHLLRGIGFQRISAGIVWNDGP